MTGVGDRAGDGAFRVLAVAAEQDGLADLAHDDHAARVGVGGVVTAHEAEHEDAVGVLAHSLLGDTAFLDGGAQRLLAEDVQAALERRGDLRGMQVRRRGDGHRVELGILEHRRVVGVGMRDAPLLRDGVELGLVHVAQGDQLRVGNAEAQVPCMLIPQTSESDGSDPYRHFLLQR